LSSVRELHALHCTDHMHPSMVVVVCAWFSRQW
jgi:hypothetical protein